MRSKVVIKSSKSGMSVFLDPEGSFEELLQEVGKKFHESEKFWGAVQMTLTLEGRTLTPEEEFKVINTITENSEVEILCLLDTDANRMERCEKALNQKLMELSYRTGQFFRGDLHRGETLESEASIVIIGNVNHGARVVAKGNIIVLGELRGNVHAGVSGHDEAVIVALYMAPRQLKIADVMGRFSEKGKRLGKGPMIAQTDNGAISIKSVTKNFFNFI